MKSAACCCGSDSSAWALRSSFVRRAERSELGRGLFRDLCVVKRDWLLQGRAAWTFSFIFVWWADGMNGRLHICGLNLFVFVLVPFAYNLSVLYIAAFIHS